MPTIRCARRTRSGKIPVLVDKGVAIYDLRVILDYLDSLAGGGKIVPARARRFEALVLQALADGILDASILRVYEVRHRPEERRHPGWVDYQADKVARGLAKLEASPLLAPHAVPDVGQIALACALGYQDLRFEGAWRAGHPRLVAWRRLRGEGAGFRGDAIQGVKPTKRASSAARPSTRRPPNKSVPVRGRHGRLLLRRRLGLITLAPFIVRHAVDALAALLLR